MRPTREGSSGSIANERSSLATCKRRKEGVASERSQRGEEEDEERSWDSFILNTHLS